MMMVVKARLIIWVIFAAAAIVACSHHDNYAPVFSNNPEPAKSSELPQAKPATSVPQSNQQPLPGAATEQPVAKPKSAKYHVVKAGETLYSIGVSSGQGFGKLSKWNNIPAPYAVKLGQKIQVSDPSQSGTEKTHADLKNPEYFVKKSNTSVDSQAQPRSQNVVPDSKPNEKSALNKAKKGQKSSIISIANEKMLKLSFQWPVTGKVLKNFPQTNYKGIDIAGNLGHPVVAAHTGKVAYSGQGLIGFGKVLIIKHNAQYLSAYANVGQIEVGEGQQVEKGQMIAKIGRSGSKKASLHFEIRKNGKPVNPLKYLPK